MTLSELRAARIRLSLDILRQEGGTLSFAAVMDRVFSRYPLSADESDLYANGVSKGLTYWRFGTAQLVKAGWLIKGGDAGWTVTPAGIEALASWPDPESFVAEARSRYASWSKIQKSLQAQALSTRIVPQDAGQEEVLRAARLFVERGMVAGESVFAPGRALWASETANELVRSFVDSDGVEGEGFVSKVAAQLREASDEARLLMAELVALQLLPASIDAIGERRKRDRVNAVLELMDHPVQIPADIDSAFGSGSFNPGTRMSSNLGAAMTIIVNFIKTWTALDADAHEAALADPWVMRDIINSVPGERFPSQRHALLYLFHPDTFVSIVSDAHKAAIREAFLGEIGEASGDIDRDLLGITLALQVKSGGPARYYREPLISKWQTQTPPQNATVDNPEAHVESDTLSDRSDRAQFPRVTPELADALYMGSEWPQQALDILERRRQIILHGPPGTGKTFIARKLAEHIASGAESILVQFHPSYSYEDFVEGYRPETVDGVLTYRLKEGPFRRIAREASKNRDRNYVLVIDEINRGNLAKVFGELYFLLEYRDASIALLYGSDDDFSLPDNVFIIGTMNTTDRSIALLDAAMRRRFAFVELHPGLEPTNGLLRAWLKDHDLSEEAANLLEALNARIPDRAAWIGPSYLMPSDHDLSDTRLREVWKYELLPLLEEYHYGEGRDIESEYGLDALRRGLPQED